MAVTLDDDADFENVVHRYRRELHVHCYRMLSSFDEAEDAVQETMIRAWAKRATFVRGENVRAWLYRIATNVCLDELRRRRRAPQVHSFADVPELQPYPDQLLDSLAPRGSRPDDVAVARDTIELAFVAALQVLPAQQRAALIMRDVIGWSAAEAAQILDTSVPALNSALQRARAAVAQHRPQPDHARRARLGDDERALLGRYIALHENPDPAAMAALVRDDIRITMPPQPVCFDGWAAVSSLLRTAFGPDGLGEWRALPTSVNRMPAAACYLRAPSDERFTAYKLDVLRITDGLIAEITTFERRVFDWLDLPAEI